MIRAVADRIVARHRPAYIGRHRRARPVLQRVIGAITPAGASMEETAT